MNFKWLVCLPLIMTPGVMSLAQEMPVHDACVDILEEDFADDTITLCYAHRHCRRSKRFRWKVTVKAKRMQESRTAIHFIRTLPQCGAIFQKRGKSAAKTGCIR